MRVTSDWICKHLPTTANVSELRFRHHGWSLVKVVEPNIVLLWAEILDRIGGGAQVNNWGTLTNRGFWDEITLLQIYLYVIPLLQICLNITQIYIFVKLIFEVLPLSAASMSFSSLSTSRDFFIQTFFLFNIAWLNLFLFSLAAQVLPKVLSQQFLVRLYTVLTFSFHGFLDRTKSCSDESLASIVDKFSIKLFGGNISFLYDNSSKIWV